MIILAFESKHTMYALPLLIASDEPDASSLFIRAAALPNKNNNFQHQPVGNKLLNNPAVALYGARNMKGDIVNTPEFTSLFDAPLKFTLRGVRTWPNGTVPYTIDPSADFTESQKRTIRRVMNRVTKQTSGCVRFVEQTTTTLSENKLNIISESGCWSYLGQIVENEPQPLSLQSNGCIYPGTIMHELLHALGFPHEHNRPDRNEYITVNFNNVQRDSRSQYDMYSSRMTDLLETNYDYTSIMHYGDTAFSVNGEPTMVPIKSSVKLLDPYYRTTLSMKDVEMIKKLYECE